MDSNDTKSLLDIGLVLIVDVAALPSIVFIQNHRIIFNLKFQFLLYAIDYAILVGQWQLLFGHFCSAFFAKGRVDAPFGGKIMLELLQFTDSAFDIVCLTPQTR
ncbi:MAG: hypothetical protein GY928_15415 [Colwellia sp.]|nr:hypothetical protein [Colwellia sp.]